MPIYEYACENCGHQLDVLQGINDPPISLCPNCQKDTLIKLVSAASFRLKGGGWYETDFKTGDKKNNLAEKGEPGTESKIENKTEGKTESKSESKTESKSESRNESGSSSKNKTELNPKSDSASKDSNSTSSSSNS
jgi:putative FmdB family regulatory protein